MDNKKPRLKQSMKKAVCLLSGGLDSTVTAYIAKHQHYQPYTITFNYGQLHQKEIKSAQQISTLLSSKQHILFDVDLNCFGGSSLLKKTKEQPKYRPLNHILETEIPSTYVPARNTVFLSLALSYAETIDADAIFIGINAVDYSGYPDCRPEYIEAFQQMANLATKRSVEKKPIQLQTPLLTLSKADIIRNGAELKVPFELTWSCYKGQKEACGQCDSCQLRLKGFKDAGLKDPISYQTYPNWYQ